MEKRTIASMLLSTLMVFVFVLYAWIRSENRQFIREPRANFGDTHEFLDSAAISIFSKSFWISLRPPIVVLFYKLVGKDILQISNFQLWFSIFSWGFLSFATASVIQFKGVKLAAFIVLLAFSLSEEIIMWDTIILGDSISISVMVLFFASIVLLLAKWSIYRFSLLFLTGTLFAFVRDDFAYYILMLSVVTLVLLLRTRKWKQVAITSIFFFAAFLLSNTLSTASLRWYRPLLNTISLRILPNPQYVAYCESRGMPVNNALLERSGKYLHADNNALVEDQRLDEFRSWVEKNGKSEYLRFLWFFKVDTFQKVFNDREIIFSPDVTYYEATRFRPIIVNPRLDELLYPKKFGFLLFFIANLVAAVFSMVAYYERKETWLLPLALILLTYPQALLVWNADANDMARHAIYHNIMLRLGIWILVMFVIDFFSKELVLVYQAFVRKYVRG